MKNKKNITVSPMGIQNADFTYKRFFLNMELKNRKLEGLLPKYDLFRRQFMLFSNAYSQSTFGGTINELVPSIADIYKTSFNSVNDERLEAIAPIEIISPARSNNLYQTLKTPNIGNRR